MDALDEEGEDYKIRTDALEEENLEMREFFDKLSVPIIKRTVKKIERQLRRFPEEALQFDSDSKLNFFEEVCVMLQEGSLDDYIFVSETIEGCCNDAYDDLTPEDKFILNHQTDSNDLASTEIIEKAFYDYASGYETKRIMDSYDNRNGF